MTIRKLYNKLPLPAKAAIWFTACNFILKGLGFITAPLFTRLLDAEEYGKLTMFSSYEQLIQIFATWEIQIGAYQKGIFKYSDDIIFFTKSVQILINILTILFFAVIIFYQEYFVSITGMSLGILEVLFIYLIFTPAYNCWQTRKRKNYEYKKIVFATIITTIVNIVLPILGIVFIEKTANIKFTFSLFGSILISLFFYAININYTELFTNFNKTLKYWKYCIVFEGPLVLHSLSYLMLAQADRIMIGNMVGNAQAAYYSIAYSIANVIHIIQISINQSMTPWSFHMLETQNYNNLKNTIDQILIVFIASIVIFLLIIPETIYFLFPPHYQESIWCIPPIATGMFFMFLYSIFVNIEEYFERTKYVVYVSTVCGLINIVLNYYLINKIGYIACAYTTLFSYILFALGHYYFMKKTIYESRINNNVVNHKNIIYISVILLVLSILITSLYNLPIIRYILLVGISLLAFKRKNQLRNLYLRIKTKQET